MMELCILKIKKNYGKAMAVLLEPKKYILKGIGRTPPTIITGSLRVAEVISFSGKHRHQMFLNCIERMALPRAPLSFQ